MSTMAMANKLAFACEVLAKSTMVMENIHVDIAPTVRLEVEAIAAKASEMRGRHIETWLAGILKRYFGWALATKF